MWFRISGTVPFSVTAQHPAYATFKASWQRAFDVYEGAGGFTDEDKPYLIAHPREFLDHSLKDDETGAWTPNPSPVLASPKLKMRRKLARYENWAAALLDVLSGSLFGQAPQRTTADGVSKDHVLLRFWKDASGVGDPIDEVWKQAWTIGGVFGHAICVLDAGLNERGTVAGAAPPSLSLYTPLDMPDWTTDGKRLTAVKLMEAVPRDTLDTPLKPDDVQYRVIDDTTITTYDRSGRRKGKVVTHGFGALPVVVLYGRKRTLTPVIGKSVMGDPQLYIDFYNLISEVRELLRNQTFALLNIPLGEKGDAMAEAARVGAQSGTQNALMTTFPANFISPSADNVTVYHTHLDRLLRSIYRLAGVPFESDSRDAESADSRRIKREEMRAMLLGFSREVARVDAAATELVFRGLYGDRWEAERDKAGVSVQYPEEFILPDLDMLVKTTTEAIALELGELATQKLKQQTARALLPDLSVDEQKQIDKEIQAQPVETSAEKQQRMLDESAARMALAGKPKQPKPPQPETVQ